MTLDALPPQIIEGAELRGKEYGWSISSFPKASATAESLGYACLGGQFQFRLDDGSTCEMYWLSADSTNRTESESWTEYCRRSCEEVLEKFRHLVSITDFREEASSWTCAIDPVRNLVLVGYFVTESEWFSLSRRDSQ